MPKGPTAPRCQHISKHATDYDYCIIFSYRYYHAYHGGAGSAGARRSSSRPLSATPAARTRDVRARSSAVFARSMYNSPEERTMIQAIAQQRAGAISRRRRRLRDSAEPQSQRFRQKYNIRGPFAVYVGRIDENKGCNELFDYFSSVPA
ncbi:MAG: hypothetical protein QM736_28075 [Vicinamibacterales bacterium]